MSNVDKTKIREALAAVKASALLGTPSYGEAYLRAVEAGATVEEIERAAQTD